MLIFVKLNFFSWLDFGWIRSKFHELTSEKPFLILFLNFFLMGSSGRILKFGMKLFIYLCMYVNKIFEEDFHFVLIRVASRERTDIT